MMRSTKSQAAMEFLMTYGWALLVVIIVIAALAVFGLLNPNRFLPEKCEFGPGITCIDFNAVTDDTSISNGDGADLITMVLNNGLATTMTGVLINITQCRNTTTSGTIGPINSIPEGTSYKFQVPCGNYAPGQRFKSDAIIVYNTTSDEETVKHIKKGLFVVTVQKTD